MDPAILYPLIGAVVLLAMLVIGVVTKRKSRAHGWEAVGKKHTLTYARGNHDTHKLAGTYRGRAVDAQIRNKVAGSGSIPVMELNFDVHNGEGSRIVLACESVLAGKLLGAEDIGIGDADFDSTFKIVSEPNDLVKRVFTPDAALRQRITALKSEGFNLSVYDGKLHVETVKVHRDEPGLQALLDTLSDLAEAVEKAS
jgi:hypothetical protein